MLFDEACKLVDYADHKGAGQVQDGAGLFRVGEEDLVAIALGGALIDVDFQGAIGEQLYIAVVTAVDGSENLFRARLLEGFFSGVPEQFEFSCVHGADDG